VSRLDLGYDVVTLVERPLQKVGIAHQWVNSGAAGSLDYGGSDSFRLGGSTGTEQTERFVGLVVEP